jgi:lysophospholipase L1-like esterase
LDQLRQQQGKLADERKQVQKLRDDFDKELRTTREGALAVGGEQARQILENIKPKQAKEQLLDMLKNDEMDKVVTLLAGMSDSKRAKIVGEFRTPEEAQQLSDILRRIREGAPEAALSDDAQQKLEPPQPLKPPPQTTTQK